MEKHLQIGPHFFQVLLARKLHHTHQHAQHPRGNAAKVGHVLAQTLLRYAVSLDLKVAQQRRLFPWYTHQIGQDRKSTRLNSSHANISYAVFCLKKKTTLTSPPPSIFSVI